MRLWRPIPRFSLRTLAIFLLLATSGMGLWLRWPVWTKTGEGIIPPKNADIGGSLPENHWAWKKLPSALRNEVGVHCPDPEAPKDAVVVYVARDGIYDVWEQAQWWGVFYLWEFWLTAAFAGLFVWSVWRDRRSLRVRDEPTQ